MSVEHPICDSAYLYRKGGNSFYTKVMGLTAVCSLREKRIEIAGKSTVFDESLVMLA